MLGLLFQGVGDHEMRPRAAMKAPTAVLHGSRSGRAALLGVARPGHVKASVQTTCLPGSDDLVLTGEHHPGRAPQVRIWWPLPS